MSTVTTSPLMYAPPSMSSPTIIDLAKTGGQDYWNFSPDQDVVFINSAHTTLNLDKVQVQGAHNIAVLGIDLHTQPGQTGALQFDGVSGTAFVDGVHIDNSLASGTDGIDIAGGTGSSLVVQNTSIENVNGAQSGGQASNSNGHADGIQTQGPVGGEIDLYNTHITTNYQGIFISPQYSSEPTAGHLTNVDLQYSGPTANDGSAYTYLLWTLDAATETPYPISFDNVYVQPRAGQDAAYNAVWPNTPMGAVEQGNHITWNGLPYTGQVTVGTPAAPFADPSQIGTHFQDAQALIDAMTGQAGPAPAPAQPVTGAGSVPSAASAPPSGASSPDAGAVVSTTPAADSLSNAALSALLQSDHLNLGKIMQGLQAAGLSGASLQGSLDGNTLHVSLDAANNFHAAVDVDLSTLSTLADLVHQGHHGA